MPFSQFSIYFSFILKMEAKFTYSYTDQVDPWGSWSNIGFLYE